jgi:mRNA interferase RelE/StbE
MPGLPRYKIRVSEAAERELRRLPGHVRQRARRTVSNLADDPRPAGARELRDLPGRYRLRLDGWRIIYRVDEEDQTLTILRVRRKVGPETYEDVE